MNVHPFVLSAYTSFEELNAAKPSLIPVSTLWDYIFTSLGVVIFVYGAYRMLALHIGVDDEKDAKKIKALRSPEARMWAAHYRSKYHPQIASSLAFVGIIVAMVGGAGVPSFVGGLLVNGDRYDAEMEVWRSDFDTFVAALPHEKVRVLDTKMLGDQVDVLIPSKRSKETMKIRVDIKKVRTDESSPYTYVDAVWVEDGGTGRWDNPVLYYGLDTPQQGKGS